MITKKHLIRIAPARAGIIFGILYGFAGLIFAPIFLLAALSGQPDVRGGGIAFAVFLPVFYAAGGLLSGLIVAALYNVVAGWTGGLEFEFHDDSVNG